uniref:Glucosamine 6-phosphate N-acetyltransferase n=1 Tax=Paramormyrops kingsleyae TaxID=1676925 RepID=A0A3B3RKJ3_9TELE
MSPGCGMLLDETPLFDPTLLQELDWSSNTVPFSPPISPAQPGEGLILRPLHTADLNRGYYKLLSQLTLAGDVTPEQFIKNFDHMRKTGDYFVIVVEDRNLGQIVATATLITEHKFIHSCAKVVSMLIFSAGYPRRRMYMKRATAYSASARF